MPGKKSSYIHSVACISPQTQIEQPAAARHLAARSTVSPHSIDRLYRLAGVDTRQTALSNLTLLYDDRSASPSTAARMDHYEQNAAALAIVAARQALHAANLDSNAVTHIITVSCTGFYAPGIDHAIIEALELNTTISRTHIGFMGCHAALNALNIADSLARANDDTVLVVCIELCSLHLQYSDKPDLLVANSLFSDGAAALVCSCSKRSEAKFEVRSFHSQVFKESADLMSWRIKDHGFEMSLSSKLPALLRSELPATLNNWSCKHAWSISEIIGWAVHPGGPRLLNVCESILGELKHSRQVLREHGNMSSPTVLFILDQMARSIGDYGLIAFGPGVSFEGAILRRL